MSRKPDEFMNFPAKLHPGHGPFRAIVRWDRQWDDADTIWMMVDSSFLTFDFQPIRFRGIDAPELRQTDTRESAVLAREYLFSILPFDCPVRLYTAKDKDQYGRYVADVIYLDDTGEMRCANVDLVNAGHAMRRPDWGWYDTMATCEMLGIPVGKLGMV